MPKYAHSDASGHVVGWYNTDKRTYANLPDGLTRVTETQWTSRLSDPNGWAVVSGVLMPWKPPVPKPTTAQRATNAMRGTVVLSSKATPSLNGEYSVDTAARDQVQAEVIALVLNGKFTNGAATIEWFDVSDVAHVFDAAQFKAFAGAVAAYISALAYIARKNNGYLPSSTLHIA